MKKIFFLISGILFSAAVFSQTVLLEQDVNADTVPPSSGPNMKSYTHSYFRYGFVVGKSDSAGTEVLPGYSNEFSFGIRHKRKLCNFYSLGFDVFYNNVNFNLKQDSSKLFPNPVLHKKEKLSYNNLGLEIFNRFNIGKRGNVLGNFVDIAGYGEWGFSIKHSYRDKLSIAQAGASVRDVTNKGLLYANNLNYGGIVRLGINRYVIYGKYRLSDIFIDSYLKDTGLQYSEFPRFIVGVEIGLLK